MQLVVLNEHRLGLEIFITHLTSLARLRVVVLLVLKHLMQLKGHFATIMITDNQRILRVHLENVRLQLETTASLGATSGTFRWFGRLLSGQLANIGIRCGKLLDTVDNLHAFVST